MPWISVPHVSGTYYTLPLKLHILDGSVLFCNTAHFMVCFFTFTSKPDTIFDTKRLCTEVVLLSTHHCHFYRWKGIQTLYPHFYFYEQISVVTYTRHMFINITVPYSWNINWLFQHCQIKMTPYPIRKRVCSNKQPNKYLSSNRLYAYLTFIQSGRVIEIFAAFQNEHEFPDSVVCSGLSQIPSSSTAW